MPKITIKRKAEILSEVRRKTTDNFHTSMQGKDIQVAENELEKDLKDL